MFATSFIGTNKSNTEYAKTKFPNGISFKTACSRCNQKIGSGPDKELKRFCAKLEKNLLSQLKLPNIIQINCRPNLIIKAAIGHLLSANYKRHKTNFDDVARIILDEKSDINDTEIKVYIWPFMGDNYLMCRDFFKTTFPNTELKQIHVLKLKPIAIAVTHGFKIKNATCLNIYKTQQDKLLCNIPIKISNIDRHPHWPASPEDDEAVLMGDSVSVFATKYKN